MPETSAPKVVEVTLELSMILHSVGIISSGQFRKPRLQTPDPSFLERAESRVDGSGISQRGLSNMQVASSRGVLLKLL